MNHLTPAEAKHITQEHVCFFAGCNRCIEIWRKLEAIAAEVLGPMLHPESVEQEVRREMEADAE